MAVIPVILCGGFGLRLWPTSRPDRPKQFAPLVGALSSFQMTVRRVAPLAEDGVAMVVTGAAHESQVSEQLAALGVTARIIIEPVARDSAAAMAAAALSCEDPQTILAFVAADHYVPDEIAFRGAIEAAALEARRGHIVTLGVKPDHPATAFGYIEPERPGGALGPVKRFVEKPDLESARRFVKEGYLWNSGNFVVSAATFLGELAKFAPDTLAAARAAVKGAKDAGGVMRLGPSFAKAPKVSVDYAVMEKTEISSVLPVTFAWSDLGTWDAVWANSPKDEQGNVSSPQTVLQGAVNVLVRADLGRRVAVVGVRDLAVVVEGDDVLVCGFAKSQDVKAAAIRITSRPHATFGDLAEAAAWFERWLKTAALPLWWTVGADHESGGFHETLSLQGAPCRSPRRVRVQARQSVVYAAAGVLGWSGPWRQATWHGMDFLSSRYLRSDGMYRVKVTPDGVPADDRAYLYDQAFVLLALASLYEAEPNRSELALAATALRGRIDELRAPKGGFTEEGSAFLLSNPHMHLLECALAWARLDPRAWADLADELAQLAMDRMFDPAKGIIRETYDQDWRPAPGLEGRIFWPGHQFEWAWLLQRWGLWRNDARAQDIARALFRSGTLGVDSTRGVAVGASLDDFSVHDAQARIWPQTERLKASLWLGDTAQALEAANALHDYLAAPVAGVWRERWRADGAFVVEPAPASSFYHIVGALSDLLRPRVGGP